MPCRSTGSCISILDEYIDPFIFCHYPEHGLKQEAAGYSNVIFRYIPFSSINLSLPLRTRPRIVLLQARSRLQTSIQSHEGRRFPEICLRSEPFHTSSAPDQQFSQGSPAC